MNILKYFVIVVKFAFLIFFPSYQEEELEEAEGSDIESEEESGDENEVSILVPFASWKTS